MTRWVIFIIIYVLLTVYGFQAIKTVTKYTWIHYIFIALAVIVVGNFIFQFTTSSEGRVLSPIKSYAFGFLLSFMALNLVLVPILFAEDMIRGALGLYDKLVTKESFFSFPFTVTLPPSRL